MKVVHRSRIEGRSEDVEIAAPVRGFEDHDVVVVDFANGRRDLFVDRLQTWVRNRFIQIVADHGGFVAIVPGDVAPEGRGPALVFDILEEPGITLANFAGNVIGTGPTGNAGSGAELFGLRYAELRHEHGAYL